MTKLIDGTHLKQKSLLMRTKNILIILFAAVLFVGCGAERNMKKGKELLSIGEYAAAADQFKLAYRRTPAKERNTRGERAKYMAYCYDRINYTANTIAALRNMIRYGHDSLDAHLTLGRQLMKNGDYKQAEKEFQLVLDSMPENALARNGLLSSRKALEWKKNGSRYTVKRMNVFNSRRSDYSPMLFGDEHDKLYFTSTRNEATGTDLSGITNMKNGDIFVSEKDNKGHWSAPKPVEGGLNSNFDEGACAFSSDQKEMFLTQCATDPSYPRYARIVKSSRSDASWGKPVDVELTRDTLSCYAHPALSPDGQWLYFVSDMPGGVGGLDIWRVRITPSGYGGVENLGEPVNTPGNEMFPTFRPNGDLYFSSDGHPGMGGLDIFVASPQKDGTYRISHPGYPLNSAGDDFGMTFEGPYNRGFFSSNRGNARGWDKIYSFENPEIVQVVKGWVYEKDGYELPAAVVRIVGSDGTNETLSVDSKGSFSYVVKPGVEYLILATCKGYLNHREQIRVGEADESQEYTLQFPLPSITVPVLIDNIFYDFDRASLRPESAKSLDNLVGILNENPNVTIELGSHCDYKGSKEYNIKLSQRRAQGVVDYLIAHGIEKERLTAKGYGKEKPKTIGGKLTEKYPWLKENDVLTEDFIKDLDKEKQDVCNQINRRTEFSVLRITYGMFDKEGNLKKTPKKEARKKAEDGSFDIEFSF